MDRVTQAKRRHAERVKAIAGPATTIAEALADRAEAVKKCDRTLAAGVWEMTEVLGLTNHEVAEWTGLKVGEVTRLRKVAREGLSTTGEIDQPSADEAPGVSLGVREE